VIVVLRSDAPLSADPGFLIRLKSVMYIFSASHSVPSVVGITSSSSLLDEDGMVRSELIIEVHCQRHR
jgi:hypothetical protein